MNSSNTQLFRLPDHTQRINCQKGKSYKMTQMIDFPWLSGPNLSRVFGSRKVKTGHASGWFQMHIELYDRELNALCGITPKDSLGFYWNLLQHKCPQELLSIFFKWSSRCPGGPTRSIWQSRDMCLFPGQTKKNFHILWTPLDPMHTPKSCWVSLRLTKWQLDSQKPRTCSQVSFLHLPSWPALLAPGFSGHLQILQIFRMEN